MESFIVLFIESHRSSRVFLVVLKLIAIQSVLYSVQVSKWVLSSQRWSLGTTWHIRSLYFPLLWYPWTVLTKPVTFLSHPVVNILLITVLSLMGSVFRWLQKKRSQLLLISLLDKKRSIKILGSDDVVIDKKGKITLLSFPNILELKENKDSFLILNFNFHRSISYILDFPQIPKPKLPLRLHRQKDKHFVTNNLDFTLLVVYLVVIILLYKQLCYENPRILLLIDKRKVQLPRLLLLYHLPLVHVLYLLWYRHQLLLNLHVLLP